MQDLTPSAITELSKRHKYIMPVVEIYPRDTVDITSISAPANAIARYSITNFDWTNSTGTYNYVAKILDFPEVTTYITEQINTAEITCGNAKRGEGSTSRFVLDNQIKGCWLVIRLILPDSPEDSIIVFWGKCKRPGKIDNETVVLRATQDIGDYSQEVPFREYQPACPLDFARPGGGCLGYESLEDKSIQYRQAVATYGTGGCNKLFSTCAQLDNTDFFQGQRIVAVSGQFKYVTTEEVVKRVLFFFSKKKTVRTVHTENWSSVNQSDSSEIVPIAFGRCQIKGHPFTWADQGERVVSLQGFCEGKIAAFNFIRSRTQGIAIVNSIEHLGDWGGVGTQQKDVFFNGTSGFNSKLAYIEVITNGSSPTQVDNAPLITAVVKGLEVPVPNAEGAYTEVRWTNNPVHFTRFILTDKRFGRIPEYRIDDAYNLRTVDICNTLIEDRTDDEAVVLPANVASEYGAGFRRFRSAARWTALKDMVLYEDQALIPGNTLFSIIPEFDEPEINWFNPFEEYTIPQSQVVLKQKYTCNGVLNEKTSVLDFLTKQILPTFKGWINYGSNGLIQIKSREKADNSYLRAKTEYYANKIPIINVSPWKTNKEGFLIIGVSLETAEIRKVVGFEYSTACNGMPITAANIGGVTATTSTTLEGGSSSSPGLGWIKLDGTPAAGDAVEISFNSGEDLFKVSYIADGVEDLPGFTRMLTAFLNAHLQFNSYLTAYISPNDPTKIWIRCESGYLNLDSGLEYEHSVAEEVLRVQAVFENCGELNSNLSAQFDNIIDGTFVWNDEEQEDINAVIGKYTSAIDDFHISKLMPRAAWDTIDLEGELKTKELDLTFVDNYWQAAYLTKCDAIENIDGNLPFAWSSDILASRLELGDVVAVRHDSGDGALNYVPVWLKSIEFDLNDFQVKLKGQLYLTAAHDLHVQPIDVLLTTTLDTQQQPPVLPASIGTNGGVSQSTTPNVIRPSHDSYYSQFNISKYSPTGLDLV